MNLQVLILVLFLALLSVVSHAQEPAGSPQTVTQPKTQTTPPVENDQKKPKKVWTNDDIGSAKGTVSVVGEPNYSSDDLDGNRTYQDNNRKNLREQRTYHYRSQIQELRNQIDGIEKRIAQLKNFKGENIAASDGIKPTQSYNMVPISEQVKKLEDKKKQLQSRIEIVESDARKYGIDPGELR